MKEFSLKEIKVIGPGSEPKRDNATAFFLALPSNCIWRSVVGSHWALTLTQRIIYNANKKRYNIAEADDSLSSASFNRPWMLFENRIAAVQRPAFSP
jgi:hypothetical protein